MERRAVAAFVDHLRLDAIDTISVHAQRCVESMPTQVAIDLEHQPAQVEHDGQRVLIRYAHRATFFPDAEVHGQGVETPQGGSELSILGRVEASHLVVISVADSEPLDADTLHAFAEADGYFIAYPYVRQTLQHLAEQVSLPPRRPAAPDARAVADS